MTGTFEYEKGDKRAVPDFNVFFRYFATYPYYSDAVWYLTQMRRWGQIAEAKPDSWYADIGQGGLPPRPLSGSRQACWSPTARPRSRLPLGQRRLPRTDRRVHRRGRPTTAASPTHTSTGFAIGLKGEQTRRRLRRSSN